jgi:ATP-dependent RNA helicase DeaD
MPHEILMLAKRHMYQGNTREIRLNKQEVGLDTIEQSYLIIDENQKLGRLVSILRSHNKDNSEEGGKGQERQEQLQQQQAIIFSATRLRADKLAANLKREGFKVSAIHGDLSQKERDRVMNRFRQGIENILVATDIAARGIDVPSVGHVINYDVPSEPETYFHRIGRTARAGAEGKAISFVTPERLGEFERIQRLTKLPIKRLNEAMGIKIPSGQNRDRGNYKGQEGRRYGDNLYADGRRRRRRNESSHHYGSRNRDRNSNKSNSATSTGRSRGEWNR